jgi:hypothetical protein
MACLGAGGCQHTHHTRSQDSGSSEERRDSDVRVCAYHPRSALRSMASSHTDVRFWQCSTPHMTTMWPIVGKHGTMLDRSACPRPIVGTVHKFQPFC